ncbi:hypothetical protein AVEN_204548-1 [Araneus ventricosus]|uniref:Uncharacterized protein n=1 Tax=Araneus ventricosus TaxID=182803 RepID=A0A4Y2MC57_ARAVE|nr:hypothetical protein AVEN_204548-1 [Araneus ventricosus]
MFLRKDSLHFHSLNRWHGKGGLRPQLGFCVQNRRGMGLGPRECLTWFLLWKKVFLYLGLRVGNRKRVTSAQCSMPCSATCFCVLSKRLRLESLLAVSRSLGFGKMIDSVSANASSDR